MSELKILGCSGGFGKDLRTTSFLWDDDLLIDAGTGVGDLSLEAMVKVDQVFLTHSHLDHIVSIPFLADAVGAQRQEPLIVRGLPETLEALKTKIFADDIWPDFTEIPSPESPFVVLKPLSPGEVVSLPGGRTLRSISVNHILPALGYLLSSAEGGVIAFSGDTTSCPSFWTALSQTPNLRYAIVETSFKDQDIELAKLSKHYCPSLLLKDLSLYQGNAEILISHLKPGEELSILTELLKHEPTLPLKPLKRGGRLRF
jgi:ribonuclease BN (tRNA processing enzyme)